MPPSMGLPGRDRLRTALGNVLHVRRAELERTLRMAGLAIVLGCGMYTAFNGTQAIFLERTGPAAYPLFFVILALSVWPAIALQAAATRRLGTARTFRYTLLGNAVIAVPIYAAYRLAENYSVSFAAYVIYSVAFEIVMLQFWVFVSQYFNILEGKRVYPVIAAGSGLGYIFAGAVTTLVARAAHGPEPLMFVWGAGAALSGLIVHRAERRLLRSPMHDDADQFLAESRAAPVRRGVLSPIAAALGYLRVSRLVLALVLLGTVLLIAMRVSDYLVAVVFVQSTNHDITALTVLIGNAWMLSYVIQLGLGLWLTPGLLAKAGVKNAILALPVATLAGFALVALAPGLSAALFLFVVRNGLQTGVDDPAQNVLSGALPEQVAPSLKTLQDNLVLPGSAVLTGVALLLVSFFFGQASVLFLAILGLIVCLVFVAAALWVRSLYVNAIYQRLRAHTLSLSDLELAIGRPSSHEVAELKAAIASDSPDVRAFAAAALGRLSPERFRELAPGLARAEDASLRRLAYQLSPPGFLERSLIEEGAADSDPWVVAAAAIAGAGVKPRWVKSEDLLEGLYRSADPEARAAAVWALPSLGERSRVAEAMADPQPRVRLEALRTFARLKGRVAGIGAPLIACVADPNLEVRREALRQAIRWSPPAAHVEAYTNALIANLGSGDPLARRLAGEAIALQCPAGLETGLGFLEMATQVGVATVEAIFRSGRPKLIASATGKMEDALDLALQGAETAGRLGALGRLGGPDAEDPRFALLRIALEDYQRHATELALAAMHSMHEKRGFARVERGLRSSNPEARAEAVETLLNFGPARLAEPLVRLLDPESFEGSPVRPLDEEEVAKLESHPYGWVKRAVEVVRGGEADSMKDLIALKKVPLFATLTLDQLSSIDRLMVTRRYLAGEQIFKWGDLSNELYVVLEGEVRIHRDAKSRQVTLATLGPSSVVGEMAPFTDQPRSAGAQATVPTVVRVLRKDRLNAILHEHPEVLIEVIRNLSQRLVVANEQLEAAARTVKEPAPAPSAAARKRYSVRS